MEPVLVTKPELADVLEALRSRERIFHRPGHGTTRRDLEEMIAPEFFEVGASGRRYGRRHSIETVLARRFDSAPAEDAWEASGFHVREIAPDLFLLTYDLVQDLARHTRRATIWRRVGPSYQIVYHQGTIIEGA